jgi:hypothetical protein
MSYPSLGQELYKICGKSIPLTLLLEQIKLVDDVRGHRESQSIKQPGGWWHTRTAGALKPRDEIIWSKPLYLRTINLPS